MMPYDTYGPPPLGSPDYGPFGSPQAGNSYSPSGQQETALEMIQRLLGPGGSVPPDSQSEAARQSLLDVLALPEQAPAPFVPQKLTARQGIGIGLSGLADALSRYSYTKSRGLGAMTDYAQEMIGKVYGEQRLNQGRLTEQQNLNVRAKKLSAGVALSQLERRYEQDQTLKERYYKAYTDAVSDAEKNKIVAERRLEDLHSLASREGVLAPPGTPRSEIDAKVAAATRAASAEKSKRAAEGLDIRETQLGYAGERLDLAKKAAEQKTGIGKFLKAKEKSSRDELRTLEQQRAWMLKQSPPKPTDAIDEQIRLAKQVLDMNLMQQVSGGHLPPEMIPGYSAEQAGSAAPTDGTQKVYGSLAEAAADGRKPGEIVTIMVNGKPVRGTLGL